MRTYHGPCGHAATDPETTTMDDGDTLLFRCPTCGVWMEPIACGWAGVTDPATVQATLGRLHPTDSAAVARMIEEILTNDSDLDLPQRTLAGAPKILGDHVFAPGSAALWNGECRLCGQPLAAHGCTEVTP